MQLDWCIRHSCTPTAIHGAWLKYRSFDRVKTLSIICPPHRKKSVLRRLVKKTNPKCGLTRRYHKSPLHYLKKNGKRDSASLAVYKSGSRLMTRSFSETVKLIYRVRDDGFALRRARLSVSINRRAAGSCAGSARAPRNL
ncbi:hypothetical protein EVAR_40397_1 [Eumeta japonica]|uniref:Uncharacterized protein n=1 Tax=Eumeta variegata TaxID=151549 RepID=A0A4C1WAA0_EUMVA|nr:hypothetical protein EVAR_40397_1 [Eumeta japonica]